MKLLIPIFSASLILTSSLTAQSPEKIANYFRNNPEADADGNGILTIEEARTHRRMQRNPSEGDNQSSTSVIPGVRISMEDSPIKVVEHQSEDGADLSFVYRKPAGEGPFPAIVFLHGGGSRKDVRGLQNDVRSGPVLTRFLEKGYIIAAATRRQFWASRQGDRPHGFYTSVEDTKSIVTKVSTIPGVNAENISLYGGSGGGILAIVAASGSKVAAVIAGEPATVVPLDPRIGIPSTASNYRGIMENPLASYKGEIRDEMRAWMEKITCPVLILQGNPEGLYKVNFELLIPEMKSMGKNISSISYPGLSHGFYWGNARTGATPETVEKVINDSIKFLSASNESPE